MCTEQLYCDEKLKLFSC